MKEFKKGNVFEGRDYVDMINHTLGTKYRGWFRASVLLEKMGLKDHMAWFVFINDETHGSLNWAWQNTMYSDGTIVEKCVRDSDDKFISDTAKYPSRRLVFKRDPDGDGSFYKCKFLGVCKLVGVDNKAKTRTLKLIADEIEW